MHYWDELKKVLACFGDSCKDFDIIEDSELAAELIKEGFTLEFMKNALIKPVLSLKNKSLLLDWWRQVEAGNTDVELPPESEIFKSENYSSFIFLYFKMATEVNVFSHLGQTLFAHMKESLFSDKVDEDSDDEEDLEENNNVDSVNKPIETEEDKESTLETNGSATEEVCEVAQNGNSENNASESEEKNSETSVSEDKPRTITSMYGKVYTLKK